MMSRRRASVFDEELDVSDFELTPSATGAKREQVQASALDAIPKP